MVLAHRDQQPHPELGCRTGPGALCTGWRTVLAGGALARPRDGHRQPPVVAAAAGRRLRARVVAAAVCWRLQLAPRVPTCAAWNRWARRRSCSRPSCSWRSARCSLAGPGTRALPRDCSAPPARTRRRRGPEGPAAVRLRRTRASGETRNERGHGATPYRVQLSRLTAGWQDAGRAATLAPARRNLRAAAGGHRRGGMASSTRSPLPG